MTNTIILSPNSKLTQEQVESIVKQFSPETVEVYVRAEDEELILLTQGHLDMVGVDKQGRIIYGNKYVIQTFTKLS